MLRYLCSLFGLMALLVACRGEAYPPLSIALNEARDSTAHIILLGDSASLIDSLRLEGETKTLYPDTNRFRTAIIAYGRGEELRYYTLDKGVWAESTKLPKTADTLARQLPDFYMLDIKGKHQSAYDLSQGKRLVLMLSDPKGNMPSRATHQAIKAKYSADSLRFVYMYLQTSDSAVQRLMKRDTLSGIALSDSLGEVSRLRRSLGIERSPKTHTLLVDSTRRITWQ